MKALSIKQTLCLLNILFLLVKSDTKLLNETLNGQSITNFDEKNTTLNHFNVSSDDYSDSKLYFYKIKQIASVNPDGFTIILPHFIYATTGIVSAYAATQNSFGDEALVRVIQHAFTHDNVVGGWLNEYNGRYYYDSCRIFTNRSEAIRFGLENRQQSIYDIDNNEVIWLY